METAAPAMPAWKLWTSRVFSALPVLMMTVSASMKLSHSAAIVEGFGKYGFAERLLLPIGVVELLSAVLYVIPRTAVLGAILVTGYLGGAVCTHVRAGEPFMMPLLLGVIAWGGLFLRDPRVAALIPLRAKS
jgi:hypothetical protein